MNTAVIFDIKRFAVHDGDGVRTTVFFKGCPLRCLWCHNPEGLTSRPQLSYNPEQCISCGRCAAACPQGVHSMKTTVGSEKETPPVHSFDRNRCIACGKCTQSCPSHALRIYGRKVSVDELVSVLLEDQEFYEQTKGGVTLSGGEPLLQDAFCAELLKELKAHGIHTAVDTSGAVGQAAIERVMPYTDIFLFDVKAFDDALHTSLTGKGNREILDNLRYIDACGKNIEVRIPFIPNGNAADLKNIGGFLKNLKHVLKVKVLPYHHFYVPKYTALGIRHMLPDTIPPDAQTMEEAVSCLRGFGLNAVDGNE